MSDGKLTIDLEPRTDADGKRYYIGRLKGPIQIDCRDGVAFLVFIADKDMEEMQICNMTPPRKDGK